MTEKTALQIVRDLVERFTTHRDAYLSSEYNETQVRREFIDPFFKALGWDIDNEKGYAEQWKEVVHEDAIKIGGMTKAPDYSFRLGGRRLFFLEAKKPSVNLMEDPAPAYQLRRYAWSAHLPLSILTDFEDLVVYDTRILPAITDKPSKARILIIHYTEYADRWDEITSIFSPEAIRKGAFDKYAETATQKRGTAEVDDAFLAEIEDWRGQLARNVALRNSGLTQRELNVAVQSTIDRVIFLRICEDRGIEEYGRLQALLNGPNTYARLREIFDRADERYNSGLFHFRTEKDRPGTPDVLTPRLAVDDKVLKDIFKRLYYPECPYEFSVLPAETLGHVYERFLGSVIRLTEGGHAKVELKPEVRKAGGVYYTPNYIVDYIVKHAVGPLLEGKTPQDVAGVTESWRPAKNRRPLAILDPACGSGSFLLGAYQFLLDWHLEQYTKDLDKWSKGKEPKLFRDYRGVWRLTTVERKRILLANIFGVDIDAQAVEVTKLSLLLKVLEGENAETLQKQFALFHERALPDLGANIKCGNSLIDPDFYEGRQGGLFDEEEMFRVNALDWNAEFPAIMGSGGFDAVIGNPPYGVFPDEKQAGYFVQRYGASKGIRDLYVCFIERSLHLLRDCGRFSFIVPSAWLGGPQYKGLREMVTSCQVENLILLPYDVFSEAYVDTTVFVLSNQRPQPWHRVLTRVYGKHEHLTQIDLADGDYQQVNQNDWAATQDKKLILNPGAIRVLDLIRQRISTTFGDVVQLRRGVLFDKELLTADRTSENSYPYFEGDVYRYKLNLVTERWVEFDDRMKERPKEIAWFEGPRILLRRLVNRRQRLMATLTSDTFITNKNLYSALAKSKSPSLEVTLGLLNSRLISYLYVSQVTQAVKDDFPQVTIKDILSLPFPKLTDDQEGRLTQLVTAMLTVQRGEQRTSTEADRESYRRQIKATDEEIDETVYTFYGLTDDEIAIVEEATKAG